MGQRKKSSRVGSGRTLQGASPHSHHRLNRRGADIPSGSSSIPLYHLSPTISAGGLSAGPAHAGGRCHGCCPLAALLITKDALDSCSEKKWYGKWYAGRRTGGFSFEINPIHGPGNGHLFCHTTCPTRVQITGFERKSVVKSALQSIVRMFQLFHRQDPVPLKPRRKVVWKSGMGAQWWRHVWVI